MNKNAFFYQDNIKFVGANPKLYSGEGNICGDTTNIWGLCHPGLYGDVSGLDGDVYGLIGDATGIVGCVSYVTGDFDSEGLTKGDRIKTVTVKSLGIVED